MTAAGEAPAGAAVGDGAGAALGNAAGAAVGDAGAADDVVGRADIERADRRLAGRIRRTPVLELGPDELGLGYPITLKLELLQHAGSFKPRGAFNRVLAETERSGAPRALVAASGGNHGAAVAHVGHALGIPAEVFVPETTSPTKQRRIADLGAVLVLGGEVYDDAQAAADASRGRDRCAARAPL